MVFLLFVGLLSLQDGDMENRWVEDRWGYYCGLFGEIVGWSCIGDHFMSVCSKYQRDTIPVIRKVREVGTDTIPSRVKLP